MSKVKDVKTMEVESSDVKENTVKAPVARSKDIASSFKKQKEEMEERLREQQKVRVLVPLGPNEKRGKAFLEIGLNGAFYKIPKGEYIDLPQSIADIIMRSQQQTDESLSMFSVERAEDVRDALS